MKRINIIKSLYKLAKADANYSSIMRYLKKENPKQISNFMSSFKVAFDEAKKEELENPEQIALLQAIQSTNLEDIF